jgi:uncharacterized protein YigA (DUF484 family)
MTKKITTIYDDLIYYFEHNLEMLMKVNDALEKDTTSFVKHRIKSLEAKLLNLETSKKELISIAQENTILFSNTIGLATSLSVKDNYGACFSLTKSLLRENNKFSSIIFYVDSTYVSSLDGSELFISLDFTNQKNALIKDLSSKPEPFCGALNNEKTNILFSDDYENIKSIAAIPIKFNCMIGVILIGSKTKHFFNPSQNTDYLKAIGQILSANLERLSYVHK